jgi:HD-like signal output (HDOD) protein
MELNALLALPLALPSVPRNIALLLAELQRAEPDLRKISQVIRTDPALTARLLRAANGPELQLSGHIHTASEALALLDLAGLRAMVAQAADTASLRAVPGVDLPAFWDYSLEVARYSRALAGVVRQNQGAAFTCGLLHAVGEWLLHTGMPAEMAAFDQEVPVLDLKRARAQERVFGYGYAQVGAGLARQWLLPQPLIDALQNQHAPFDNEVYEPLAGVIHLAAWRARAALAGLNERAVAATFPGSVGEVLGLDVDMVLQQDPFDWFARS